MGNHSDWYQLPVEDVLRKLEAGVAGLTSGEASGRLTKYGPNELTTKKPSVLRRFLRQFNNPLVYVLLVAAAITGILTLRGEHMLADTSVILGVVILNVILGFIQEGKTESALEALSQMIVRECMVIRDGESKVIPARELVPGDVVLLTGGDRVPADLRLFFTKDVAVDESALTGESVPVGKNTIPIPRPNLSPGDQQCMAFSGTFMTRGSARGIVVATAESTEFGKIARLVKGTRKVATPLQRKIAAFTKTLMIAIFTLGGINLLLGYLFGFSFSYSFLATIALIVAAMPEMLPMLVTSILALASSAMARRHALIRLLPAAETLGSTTVICSDKTGTLTKNEMTVVRVYAGGKDYGVSGAGYQPLGEFTSGGKVIEALADEAALAETLRAGLLCSDTTLRKSNGSYEIVGDPTEAALVVVAAKAGIASSSPRLDEIPFESERMYMATLYEGDTSNLLYVKGSPELVLRMCQSQLTDCGVSPIKVDTVLAKADEMAGEGLRIIGMAYKTMPKDRKSIEIAHIDGLVFLGLQGMIDPPREEVIEAIHKCKMAGIRPVMITGDHAKTARAIARQLGIIDSADGVLTGEQLSRMSDDELYGLVNKVSVYARVAPEHKLRIARQLQRRGEIVAMVISSARSRCSRR